ncbi:hypothetical protein [Paenibacillus typhae]|uniref:Uncharacterized protein n=1 Tax=Paenibacillus typhae TaxID=1174501 RepID=A0A1G8GAV8_9BACL|nr:hypothetical protein [Paenibacillus typhae]SDH91524.1 hypothetical protein SAMN05216192_10226 [Paenibacillus typhae]
MSALIKNRSLVFMRGCGSFRLKEIRQFVHNRNLDDILLLLKEQRSRTEEKIREFEQIQRKIDQRIHQIEDAAKTEELYTVRLTELPERTMIILKQSIRRSDNLEMWIRHLENSSPLKSSVFLGQVGKAGWGCRRH